MADRLDHISAALSGSYRVEREVGVGGMATVYLAHDLKHDRKVALKILRPELTAAMGTDRFPREIHIIAQLQHPHILPLYDSGEVQGFLYYVMPYVEGESLRAKLSRTGPLPINEAVRLLHEITDALAYAHARGIVHRDIKPDNVMISGRHAAVTDFGVAKAVSASAGDKLTTVGIAVGTPQYMAPEQAMAEPNIDHRADLYALGVMGYEMLTGHPPFEGASAQAVLSAHVMEKPKNAADRWQSADELLAQLELVASTPSGGVTPTTTRPFQATEVRPRTSRRAWILGALAVLVLGGGGVAAALLLGGGGGGIQRIAVLPIEDISGKDAVFVDAMQDALNNALNKLGTVGVASRSSMAVYKTTPKPTRDIAEELDLDAVLETTVFRSGDVMRINVQFTDPVTTRSLWSETYERDVKNVLVAQSEIVTLTAAAVAKVLKGAGK